MATNKKTWEEFRATGLLWFINTILHMFGWAIVINKIETEGITETIDVYPARVEFRGFSESSNTKGYINVTKYLKENIDTLLEETEK